MSARKRLLSLSIPLLSSVIILAIFVVNTASKSSPQLVTNVVEDFSGNYETGAKMGYFFEKEVSVPAEVKAKNTQVLGDTSNDNKWIEIDLSEQKLKAWDGGSLFVESLVSSGLPWWPTPTGEFRIWYKTRYTRMRGGSGRYAYNLPNVPFTMFFENDEVPGHRGYGVHGAYWHNEFGTRRSHGCVNLPIPIAEKLFYWTTPTMGSSGAVRSSADNAGTKIVIHE